MRIEKYLVNRMNRKSFGRETWPIMRYSHRKKLGNILHDMEDWVLNPGLFNLLTYRIESKSNNDEFVIFHSISSFMIRFLLYRN